MQPTDTAGASRLDRSVGLLSAAHPGMTGIHPMTGAVDAFAARALLAEHAERSLDVQYYIWHGDTTGYLLFEALWRAAERGVRVRLLLDDNNTAGLDPTIAALDAHRNIEVRLYNPLRHRGLRLVNYLTDFARLNRRMHNKSFTADDRVTVVGGRNVGDEYFGAGSGVGFMDLDVIAIGAAVPRVSASFDRYWNSASAYPAERLVGTADTAAAAALQGRFASTRADPEAAAYLAALRDAPSVRDLLSGQISLEWSSAQLLVDDPAKTLAKEKKADLLLSAMLRATGAPQRSFDLVSPYFVPGDDGTKALASLARAGVRVRVLTNSLAATDVSAVHAGYAKRRHDLLRAGVQLFELKPTAKAGKNEDARHLPGKSAASLHAKTFAIDGHRFFVGSFNFDERSARLNTEMGLLIDSEPLASGLVRWFDDTVPQLAYQVRLAGDGSSLQWVERTAAGETVHGAEPGAGILQRGWVRTLTWLPIDWLL